MKTATIAQTSLACLRAQNLYLRDVERSGRIARDWHALDYQTRHAYVDRAVLELAEESNVVAFPLSVRQIPPADVVPHAVRNIECAIADLVNAANDVQTERDAVELQSLISDLTVKLNAVSEVAWHREQQFFPRGA